MERENYAVGHCVLGAHSINAPHQRQRLFWVADRGISDTENGNGWGESQQPSSVSGQARNEFGGDGSNCGVADTASKRQARECGQRQEGIAEHSQDSGMGELERPSPDDIDWLYCRDSKYRPIKSSIKPLVNGVARGVVYRGGTIDPNNTGLARAIRLKGYGNAINADVACEFIKAFMDVRG